MAKRIYWETIKKWALITRVPVGVAGFALLFMYLSALGVIDVTGYSGDMICAGTLDNPCIALINFSVREDIFIYPTGYDPYGRDTPFYTDEGLKSWKIYRSWGSGWREIKLNDTCTGTWCGAPNNKGVKYSFVFREGRDYKIKIVALKEDPTQDIKWGFGPVDPAWYGIERDIGYEFLDDDKIVHIWNTQDDYFFDKDSGIQFTNYYEDYWTKNIFCIGYYSGTNWVQIKCADELINFNKNIHTDNSTYVNATLWKDIAYGNYDLRLGVNYYLGLDDENLSITIYGKNIGVDIPFDLGFAWKITDVNIPISERVDKIIINTSEYYFNTNFDLTFKDMTNTYLDADGSVTSVKTPFLKLQDKNQFLRIDWKENLDYTVQIHSNGTQESFYAIILINASRFIPGVPKSTTFKWIDAEGDSIGSCNYATASGGANTDGRGVAFNGTHLFIPDEIDDSVYIYDTSCSHVGTWDISAKVTDARAIDFNGSSYFINSFPSYDIDEFLAIDRSWVRTIDTDGNCGGQPSVAVTEDSIYCMNGGYTVQNFTHAGVYVGTVFNAQVAYSFGTNGSNFFVPGYYGLGGLNRTDMTGFQLNNWDMGFSDGQSFGISIANGSIWVINFPTDTLYEFEGYDTWWEIELPPDLTPPNVTIDSPKNKTYNTFFNATATVLDDESMELGECWVTIDGGVSNLTMLNESTRPTVYNYSAPAAYSDGGYLAEFFCYDTEGNVNDSESISFTMDFTNPDINITFPINLTLFSINTVDVNYTYADLHWGYCWYSNGTYQVNTSLTDCGTNITDVIWADGEHNVTVWGNDSVGNVNFSKVTFIVDANNPDINIIFPTNNTYSNNDELDVNYTYSDLNEGDCWWSNDTMTINHSLASCGTNITTIIWNEGNHNVTVWGNDTFGHENYSSVTFTIDKTNPDINITTPINNIVSTNADLDVNYTAYDLALSSFWWSNDTMTINHSLGTAGSPLNITNITWSEGLHNVTVWANDSAGNENYSSVTFRIDLTNPNINITFPINNTNHTNLNLNVNFTRSDVTLETCWYSNDTYSVNITLPSGENITDVIWSLAKHNVTVWCNDSGGNENSSSISFSVYKIEEYIVSREVELGSNIVIIANSTLGLICVDIDHPDYGINYSCSSDVNIGFNISYFRKKVSSDGNLTVIKSYFNSSTLNLTYLNISSHQYDEIVNMSVNMSGEGIKDLRFYKSNTTSFDRYYKGYSIGSEIYLNETCDSSGVGICVGVNNLSFPDPGSQTIYFYIDDNIKNFNFTLDVSGDLYGFEFNDTFDNDIFIDWDLSDGQLDLAGTLMPANSSYKKFVYDDFEDESIDGTKWAISANGSFSGNYIFESYVQETEGYIQFYQSFIDPGDDYVFSNTMIVRTLPGGTNQRDTDEIVFNLSSVYSGTQNPAGCSGWATVQSGGTLLWTSMFYVSNSENEFSTAGVTFELKKINSSSWQVNISGNEYSTTEGTKEQWYNWTNGTWSRYDGESWVSGYLENVFYFSVNYSDHSVELQNRLSKGGAAGCTVLSVDTKMYFFNNSKWKRTNGTFTSKSVFDSSGDIADATFIGYGYEAPGEVIIPYLSADAGTTWEEVNMSVKHNFAILGKHLMWRINFTNVSVAYTNITSFVTKIYINTTISNPSNVTLDFGDDGITNITIGGTINSTNGTFTLDLSNQDLTDSFTSRRRLYDHLYAIPLVVYSDSRGYINLGEFNLTYNPNPVYLNVTKIQDFLDYSVGLTNFSIPIGTYSGNLTLDDLRFDYAGGNDTINITVHTPNYDFLNQTNITLWYSRWDYNFVPIYVEYLEFLPSSPTSKNVTPYGQSSNVTVGAIFNLTNYGYGGRDINLSIYLNQTLSCVNLTISLNHNKSDGFLINESWLNLQKLSYLETTNFWMWADYDCDYSSWNLFNPFIYFRQCAENCTCSEAF